MTERLVTSPTGGMKNSKPAQLSGVDPRALLILAEVSGKGAEKYGDPFNYLKGYDWSLSFNALQRHALAFWAGEDNDPESGLPHMGHAAWHALALVSFLTRELGTDDRFKQPPTVDEMVEHMGKVMDDLVEKATGSFPPGGRVHNHGIDPSCREHKIADALVGECIAPIP